MKLTRWAFVLLVLFSFLNAKDYSGPPGKGNGVSFAEGSFETVTAAASESGKMVLLDFFAVW